MKAATRVEAGFKRLMNIFTEPLHIFTRLMNISTEPLHIFTRPLHIFTGPLRIFTGPLHIFTGPLHIFTEPLRGLVVLATAAHQHSSKGAGPHAGFAAKK